MRRSLPPSDPLVLLRVGPGGFSVGAAGVTHCGSRVGWARLPLADGGEGILEALGGVRRATTVRGPLGGPVDAEWRMRDDSAVIEMAKASAGLCKKIARKMARPGKKATAGEPV